MKTNRVVKELAWSYIFVLFLLLTILHSTTLRHILNKAYLAFPSLTAMLIIPILFGMLLGLPSLLERRNHGGHFDWLKLLIQGLPALGLSVPFVLNMVGVLNRTCFDYFPRTYLDIYAPTAFIVYLAGVWFGKVFVDCFNSVTDKPWDA